MKPIKTYSGILLTGLLLTTAIEANEPVVEDKSKQAKEWGYVGEVAPKHWSELSEKFKMCAEGKQQSPINIEPNENQKLLPDLDIQYIKSSKSLAHHTHTGHTKEVDNGHTVEVELEEGNFFNVDGETYELKQFHFHTPSENHIDGKSYPLEAHFVHATKEGKLAVIAVVFEEGKEHPTLKKLWKHFPMSVNNEMDISFDADDLNSMMPDDKSYYRFNGSLTTPPCTEGVKWFVFKTPLTVSKEEIEAIYKELGHTNNRPVQPTNNREIDG